MRNKDNTRKNKTASLQDLLMVVMLAAVAFFAGYYIAAMRIAAILTNHE